METLLGVSLGLLVLISAVILPWINLYRSRQLQQEIENLKRAVANLPQKDGVGLEQTDNRTNFAKPVEDPTISQAGAAGDYRERPIAKPDQTVRDQPPIQTGKAHSVNIEQQFGARLPVWIGGIALALAGFFLVKYSLEKELLSPVVRIILGGLLGLSLLFTARKVSAIPDFANGARITQSLAGSGIAVLYIVSYAAARLYHLIPPLAGFAAMAAVTATALLLALSHGPAIAVLGLAGGFLTPALLSSGSGDALSLFAYLYFTASGLLIVIRRSNWWWLSIPTILATLIWVVFWLFSRYTPSDSIWLALFLGAISATIVTLSRDQYAADKGGTLEGAFKLTSILNYIALAGSLFLMGIVAGKAGFGWVEWGLFALLAFGSIGLAFFDDRLYWFVPWVSMAVNAVMLGTWSAPSSLALLAVFLGFAAIYTVSGYFLVWRARLPVLWGALTVATALGYYLLAWFKFQSSDHASPAMYWAIAAACLALVAIAILFKITDHLDPAQQRERLLAMFVTAATSFITLALFIALDREFLSVAVAVQTAVLAWLSQRVSIPVLRYLTGVMAVLFAFLLSPQILLMVQLTIYSLIEAKIHLQTTVPIVEWPLFQLGIPAVCFVLSAWLLLKKRDDRLVQGFEISAILLIAVMGYYLTRNSFHADQNVLFIRAGFLERGAITNILMLYGLLCCWLGVRLNRSAVSTSGTVLIAIGLFRIGYFDLLIHNPLWDDQKIHGVTVLNTLLLPFGIPLVWCWLSTKLLNQMEKQTWVPYLGAFALLLLFTWCNMNLRFLFHGDTLDSGPTSDAEVYSYSALWLVLGIGLLVAGVLRRNRMLRFASLAVILLSIAKVFLYDASALQGLFRVFSFFGLGLILIGLSYFYTRFVFAENPPKPGSG